jgi:solute carrier family 25 (mitochondrial phosphate transporter), member 3
MTLSERMTCFFRFSITILGCGNTMTIAALSATNIPKLPLPQMLRDFPQTGSHERDAQYYCSCAFGGVVASTNRWIQQPLDVAKVRMQVLAGENRNTFLELRAIYVEEGVRGWYKGLAPTALAYASQTGAKYFFYELFKDQIASTQLAGQRDRCYSRELVYLGAAAAAEMIATVLMCPWEMIKVRLQTSTDGTFPERLRPALAYMIRNSRKHRFPFGSLGPLWFRQVPGTMANFLVFERTVEAIYSKGLHRSKADCSKGTQLAVTFIAGYAAGIACAVCKWDLV